MKTIKDWKTEQELEAAIRWTPRWSVEPAQTLRFLAEPAVLKIHAGKMFSLVCQVEFLVDSINIDQRYPATYACRLCEEGKPPRTVGLGIVEKDGDGLPRLLTAGMEKFWSKFLQEHGDVYLMQAFRISYTHETRKWGWKQMPDSKQSETFVGPDFLEQAARMLASDEWFDKYSIKFPWAEHYRNLRKDAIAGTEDDDDELGCNTSTVHVGSDYDDADNPEV